MYFGSITVTLARAEQKGEQSVQSMSTSETFLVNPHMQLIALTQA